MRTGSHSIVQASTGAPTYSSMLEDALSPRPPAKVSAPSGRGGKGTAYTLDPPPWRTVLSTFVHGQLLSTPGSSLTSCPHILIALCRHPYPAIVSASYQHLFNLYEERRSLARALTTCGFEPVVGLEGAGPPSPTAGRPRPPAFALIPVQEEAPKRVSVSRSRVVPMEAFVDNREEGEVGVGGTGGLLRDRRARWLP
jgi:hypothetical protein